MRNNHPVVALIQARMSSSRLPGKVLKPVLGKPLLLWQVERLRKSVTLDTLVVATSDHSEDDAVFELCTQNNVACFRGDLNDVLQRMCDAAKKYYASTVVRLTGDCPLLDYRIVDRVVTEHLEHSPDITSNAREPIYPDGMDVEVCSFDALHRACEMAQKPSEREHVTLFLYNHPEQFVIRHCKALGKQYAHVRLTVDEPEDFEKVRAVFKALAPGNSFFSLEDILGFLREHPELEILNAHSRRNEGLERSLEKEQQTER